MTVFGNQNLTKVLIMRQRNTVLHINKKGKNMLEGILGLLHIIVCIWAIINIVGSGASGIAKILWTLFVLIAPIIGLIIWFFAGPKS